MATAPQAPISLDLNTILQNYLSRNYTTTYANVFPVWKVGRGRGREGMPPLKVGRGRGREGMPPLRVREGMPPLLAAGSLATRSVAMTARDPNTVPSISQHHQKASCWKESHA